MMLEKEDLNMAVVQLAWVGVRYGGQSSWSTESEIPVRDVTKMKSKGHPSCLNVVRRY